MAGLAGPVAWLVRALSWLPEGLRPGAFAFLLVLITWGFIAHHRAFWHAACRAVAVAIHGLVGLLLLPEYAVTTIRRQRGGAPGPVTLVVGDVLERALDGSARLFELHAQVPELSSGASGVAPNRSGGRPFPWRLAGALLAIPIVGWIVMEHSPDSVVAEWTAEGWAYWNDLQQWAGVETPLAPPVPGSDQPAV